MLKNPIFVKRFFSMIWFLIFVILIVALGIRIYACIRKSKEPGNTWDLKDKYAPNEFGE